MDLELPAGLPGISREAQAALNERLRLIADHIRGWDLDAGGKRIRNLGNPVDPTDALSLRFADNRFVRLGAQLQAGPSSGPVVMPGTGAEGPIGPAGPPGASGLLAWAPDVTAASGTVTPDHANFTHFLVNVTGDFTLANPTGIRDAVPFELRLKFDSTGGQTVTLGTAYANCQDIIPLADSTYVFRGIGKGSALVLEGINL